MIISCKDLYCFVREDWYGILCPESNNVFIFGILEFTVKSFDLLASPCLLARLSVRNKSRASGQIFCESVLS
jgi:hypothetical protein